MKGSVGGNDKDGQVKLMYVDVKKAHLNGEVDDDDFAYITLPKEVGGGVGRLRRWLYGMRPAASAWEEHYAANLKNEGYERGRAAPTAFTNKETGVRVVVWGDDLPLYVLLLFIDLFICCLFFSSCWTSSQICMFLHVRPFSRFFLLFLCILLFFWPFLNSSHSPPPIQHFPF